jgi:hypothetical protein
MRNHLLFFGLRGTFTKLFPLLLLNMQTPSALQLQILTLLMTLLHILGLSIEPLSQIQPQIFTLHSALVPSGSDLSKTQRHLQIRLSGIYSTTF